MHSLPDGDQQVNCTETGDGSAEVRIVPNAGQRGIHGTEVIQLPRFHPGEYNEESADFKREDHEADGPQANWRSAVHN